MGSMRSRLRFGASLSLMIALLTPSTAGHADDTTLFLSNVAPNVVIIMDNSASMRNSVWHPDFDKGGTIPDCGITGFFGSTAKQISSPTVYNGCGHSFTAWVDPDLSGDTWWDIDYLNWILSLDPSDTDDASILADLAATTNGTRSNCLGGGTYGKFRRTRVTATKDILRTVICEVNQQGSVRFGLAKFRLEELGWGGDSDDPNGGFVVVPIDDWSSAQDTAIDNAINALEASTWTPLAETLFQIYTYFLSRDSLERPIGADSNPLPEYTYNTSSINEGGSHDPSNAPGSPVQYSCQKNFIVIITDGISTKDDFDREDPTDTAAGFGSDNVVTPSIGDYNNDSETEYGLTFEGTRLLDDIAKYIKDTDMYPDSANPSMAGMQNAEVYTVGFTTEPAADAILEKTADVGCSGDNCFFRSDDAEELASQLVAVVGDIVEKAQGFTSATVPATRTASGGNFYTSTFFPSGATPFWEGHIQNWTITSTGEIFDSADPPACALDDDSGNCLNGSFLTSAVPHWDAADVMPDPGSRTVYMSKLVSGTPAAVEMLSSDTGTATDLGVSYPPATPYPNSNASDAEGLADEIVQYIRGCTFGTGVTDTCLERQRPDTKPRTLGDVFHSNPVVVGAPASGIFEASYVAFATSYAARERLLIAGANDGLAHAFAAGDPTDASDHGSGIEQWAFMPWWTRTTIKNLPIDDGGNRTFYGVDGSPAVADIWDYSAVQSPAVGYTTPPSGKASDGSEWRTVLLGSLRQGGDIYYALDLTDASETDVSEKYLWEFPAEGDSTAISGVGIADFMGETWSTPVITKVRVTVPGDISGGVYERYVAIFGAGYDVTGDPNHGAYDSSADSSTSRAGRAVIMLDLVSGKILGMHFYSDVNVDDQSDGHIWGRDDMKYAFASAPTVLDLNFDGYGDVVYIGDLGGNLWKWVIDSVGVDTVNPSENSDKHQDTWEFGKVFEASTACIDGSDIDDDRATCEGDGGTFYRKSFYFPPSAVEYSGDLWLAMGSGNRANVTASDADPDEDQDNDRMYAFKDPNSRAIPLDLSDFSPDPILESDLDDITDEEGCASLTSSDGYYIVGRDGEKWVTNSEIVGYNVFAGSFIPGDGGDCSNGGQATLYIFRVNCGAGFFPDETGADERRMDLGEGVPTDPRLSLGEENRIYVVTSENEVFNPPLPPLPPKRNGMLYWRELQ